MTNGIESLQISTAAAHYRKFCEALGIDLSREDTKDTPNRVAKMFATEFMLGLKDKDFTFTTFPVEDGQGDQLVVQCGIRYASLCAHHHLPFTGMAHVCYLPNKKLAGLSKLARLVKWVARKPSVQETFIGDIVAALVEELKPKFVGVSISGIHHCMTCRGVMETSAITLNNKFWCLSKNEKHKDTKAEFMQAINQYYQLKGVI